MAHNITAGQARPGGRPPLTRGILLDAEKLDHELARRGLSASDLSRLSGVTEATISQLRHGHRRAQHATLARLAAALLAVQVDETIDWLIAKPGGVADDRDAARSA